VCFAVAIVINKLSHLSDRVCSSCWRRKVRNLFQLFDLVIKELYKRRERSESRSFRFKRQLLSSVSLSQRSLANRKVFRIGLHATASKSSPRKALFSSMQEQNQHQPKDNFLEEHITYQVCLKLMKLK
jgi:hypothetical protein